ncbi:MAG: ATP-dependent 6-phosphofructokinase [Clostridiales bacterium]|nr:MAG: ATP-dependent 6-phosphofructokinase [Clostridiales bacterium]
MEKKFKRIGVLTSGGDAPGMNAAIRAVVRSASYKGIEVMGIYCGYKGLLENDMKLLTQRDVSNIINHGGTMLYSNRCDKFKTQEGLAIAVENCRRNGIDGIVTIGGDGTFRGATDLSRLGIPCIGIPGTIDRDISATEYTIGYDTAKNTVIEMVDRLRDTCESHARCNVVEVMGRNAGYIALDCGIAVGAVGIAIKEIEFDKKELIDRISALSKTGKRNFIVIASEGLGATHTEELAVDIEKSTGIETRFARLAHVQRGGCPTCMDRVVATMMGDKAVDLLLDGKYNLVVCYNNAKVCAVEMEYAFELDRIVKGKATQEEIAALDPADREKMLAEAKRLKDEMQDMYEIAKIMAR